MKNWRSWLSNFYWEMGVDFGSSNLRIYLKDKGLVIDEPTMLSRLKKKKWVGLSAPRVKVWRPIAYGDRAKEMVNREPKTIEVVSPVRNGTILDMEAAEELMSYYFRLVYEVPSRQPKIFKPKVIVGVPSFINQVQKRAVRSIFLAAGAGEVLMLEGTVLAAVGLGLPVDRSVGLMVADFGGGKTEVSVVSMGGVVVGSGSKVAGDDLDEAVVNYLRMKYGLLVGKNSAERIKMELGNLGEAESRQRLIKGRDLETGLPRAVKISESEIREAIGLEVGKLVKLLKKVLDETPPELTDDVLKRGVIMVGNGAKLKGLDQLLERELKINVRLAEEPGMCVIRGQEELIRNADLLKRVKLVSIMR